MGKSPPNSQGSLAEANRDRAEMSDHGGMGAAGYISPNDASQAGSFLSAHGDVAVVDVPAAGFLPDFRIGVAWDNVSAEDTNLLKKILKKDILKMGVDLDLGCLYKLKNGSKGGMQALGNIRGSYENEPYISLSRDERTGDKDGQDETILVNGAHWKDIEQILIYVYIYEGAEKWADIHPQIQVRVPGEQPMIVTLNARVKKMTVCAVAGLENVRGGIKMTNYLEYFPGHIEMDRAFGFGLVWEDGEK